MHKTTGMWIAPKRGSVPVVFFLSRLIPSPASVFKGPADFYALQKEMTYLLSKIPLRLPVRILNIPRRRITMHAAVTMMIEG